MTNVADRQIPEYLNYVGPGWRDILLRTHAELVAVLPNYQVVQVKEKYGMLDVNLGGFVDPVTGALGLSRELGTRVSAILTAAREESLRTCEVCGEPGTETGQAWIKTLCPTHAQPC
ncbi:TraR/DksA family transcriptional regulator [Actinomadura sp. WMMA1423]|uniref:TraR/DksA family transcriptional regulator n=1 Tax=Actinomadura sp. WMMA1423 TaxID=2591108 RepID=UPI0011475AB1|nr:TraR/DksA family transcriptional regulator [Actinomadura sp. WMMA1423]